MKNLLLLILLTTATFTFGQREIKDQSLILNNGTDRNSWISINLGLPGQPKIRYNVVTDVWEYSNDGTAWNTFTSLEYVNTQLALKAPLASPALTGVPTAPTAAAGTNTTQLATTAFVTGELNSHLNDTIDAHDASAISSLPSGNLAATDVQGAVNELQSDVDTRATSAALAAHEADTTTHGTTGNVVGTSDAQTLTSKTIDADLNAVSNIDVGELKSGVLDADLGAVSTLHDTVPSALATKNYIDSLDAANDAALNNHLADTIDAHDAAAISVAPITNLTATDAQQGFTEHQGDIDSLNSSVSTINSTLATKQDASTAATDAELAAHEADTTTVHGIADTSLLVTTTGTQTLTNKTISGASIQSPVRSDVKQDTLANLETYALTASEGQIVYATDTDEMYQIINNALEAIGGGGGDPGILVNSNFDKGAASWTVGAGSTATSTTRVEGKFSLQVTLSAQVLSVKQFVSTNASALSGLQGLGYMYAQVPAGNTVKLCAIQNSVTSTSLCDVKTSTGAFQLFKIPFILDGTNSGIELLSTAAITGVVRTDKGWVGAVDLKADVDQSRIAGESYFAGATGCIPTTTSATIAAFPVDTDCLGPTIVRSSMGLWQTTDSDLIRQTVNNLPSGVYKATFIVPQAISTSPAASALAINDGSTTCQAQKGNDNSSGTVGITVSCTFSYSSSGNRSFELYGAVGANSLQVNNDSSLSPTKFILEYFGSGSVYSSTNADTDWQSCGHTTSDFTGFGTVTNIETQCKRQGSDLLMRGKFTAGTSTTTEARLALRLQGQLLTSASTAKIPTVQVSGIATYSAAASLSAYTLIEPSVTYMTFGLQNGTNAGLTKANGSTILGTGNTLSINARIPINGWENSNVIIGSFADFNYVHVEATDTVTQSIATGTGPVIVYESESIDTHNAYNNSSGIFTAPITGVYCASANASIPSSGSVVLDIFASFETSDGRAPRGGRTTLTVPSGGGVYGSQVSTCLKLLAGQTASVTLYQSSGAARSVETSGTLTITRIPGQFP